MIKEFKVSNFKSIINETIELSNVNVFIGENGCGKTNILEAVAMFSAAKDRNLNINGLSSKGVRVTKPLLTMSSFIGQRPKKEIIISAVLDNMNVPMTTSITPFDIEDIYTEWRDAENSFDKYILDELISRFPEKTNQPYSIKDIAIEQLNESNFKEQKDFLTRYLIYNLNTQSLRGISIGSKEIPLGINGEGLDVLLHQFSKQEWIELKRYNYLISWLDEIVIDETDSLKYKGHKLGRSTSLLYFKDKFMRKNNNVFAAENSNEGILNILFYLALLISRKTPKFFAIDNIESSLNPKLCRRLMKLIADLAIEQNKQVLITTHNPAILDGINLFDDKQRLFVVKREDEGYTKVERIKLKPEAKEKDLKLSEMWMRGYLGGLPNNF